MNTQVNNNNEDLCSARFSLQKVTTRVYNIETTKNNINIKNSSQAIIMHTRRIKCSIFFFYQKKWWCLSSHQNPKRTINISLHVSAFNYEHIHYTFQTNACTHIFTSTQKADTMMYNIHYTFHTNSNTNYTLTTTIFP